MKKLSKCLALFLSVALCIACLGVSASATNNDTPSNEITLTPEDFLGESTFEPMTRDEYIQSKAELENRTYEDVANESDQEYEAALAALPAPYAWEGDTMIPEGGGVTRIYGRVIYFYTHPSGLTIGASVQAQVMASHYGKTWVSCSSVGNVLQSGVAQASFDGNVTASIITTTQLRVVLEGTLHVETEVNTDIGFDLELIKNSYQVGNTVHYYEDIYAPHVEKLSQSN